LKNFIETFDNALTENECNYIINYMNTDDRLTPGTIQSGVNKKVKDSFDVFMNLNNDDDLEVNEIIFKAFCNCLEPYVKKHTQLNRLAPWKIFPLYNLQKYNPQQGYHSLHCENSNPSIASSHRVMAWMFYLNTVTDGGGTYFDNYDLTMDAIQGRGVIWPAYWTHMHRGIVSKTETKYIATGWVSYTVPN
jgi:hypothetical protein